MKKWEQFLSKGQRENDDLQITYYMEQVEKERKNIRELDENISDMRIAKREEKIMREAQEIDTEIKKDIAEDEDTETVRIKYLIANIKNINK